MGGNRKNICIAGGIILAATILFIGIMSIQVTGDKIVKNTYVNNVYIGGLTSKEAIDKLNNECKINDLELKYKNETYKIEKNKIDLVYNTSETVEKAYDLNRKGNFFENIKYTIQANFSKQSNLKFSLLYDKEKMTKELEDIAKTIDQEVKDASINISGSGISVIDEEKGLKVNIEDNIKNIEKQIINGTAKTELIVAQVEPQIKKEQLQGIDTVLGSYSTKVTGPVSGKYTNIRLATQKTSDVLVMPGQTFSYNKHTGMRSIANGFTYAPVIVQGSLQEGLGGGVCQVSSTLYNATLYAGLEYVNLKNHSIPSGYVDMGRDATVSDSGLDFVFKNNLKHPIYVKNYMSGNTIVCKIYGSSEDKQNIQISTNVDKTVERPIKKVEDPTIVKGEEKVLEKGRNSYTVSTYRIYKDNSGKTIRTEKVYTSYYPMKQEVVAVGTKEEKPVEPEVPKDETAPKPEETPQPEVPKPETPETSPEVPQTQPEQPIPPAQ